MGATQRECDDDDRGKPLPYLQPQISLFFISLDLTDGSGPSRYTDIPTLLPILRWANAGGGMQQWHKTASGVDDGGGSDACFPIVRTTTFTLPVSALQMASSNVYCLEYAPRPPLVTRLYAELVAASASPTTDVYLCLDGVDEVLYGARLHRARLLRYLAGPLDKVTLISGRASALDDVTLTCVSVPDAEECEHGYVQLDGLLLAS